MVACFFILFSDEESSLICRKLLLLQPRRQL